MAPPGASLPLQPDDAAGRGDRIAGRTDDVLVGREHDVGQILGDRLAGDGHAVAVQIAAVEQRLHQHRHAADLAQVLGDVAAAGLQVGDVGRALEDLGNVVQVELDARTHARSPADAGRHWSSRRRRRRPRGVLQRLAGDDVARADVALEQVHHRLARGLGIGVAALIGRRSAGRAGQRQADRLGDAGHGVGGELAAAGAGRRAGDASSSCRSSSAHLAGAMRRRPPRTRPAR